MLFFSVFACEKTDPVTKKVNPVSFINAQDNNFVFTFDNDSHFSGTRNDTIIFDGFYFLQGDRMVVSEFNNYQNEEQRYLFEWEGNIYIKERENFLIFTNFEDHKYFEKK